MTSSVAKGIFAPPPSDMIIRFILLLVLSCGLTGCDGKPKVPWSLEGKTVPEFKIINRDKLTDDLQITYSLSVVVSPSLSKDELILVSQRIIEQLPRHNLALIFYYSDAKDVNAPFTVGKAWWGINSDHFPPPGDYTHNVLEVERK